ncbi:M14 family metallopeptidase [Fodinibius sp. Rm-B-1B1-1]|uniref:M14 family metallopeptidase n=1 Tax=Fodinibius alkaliphilus TaxID=3140241 RepID=UPI00315A43FB
MTTLKSRFFYSLFVLLLFSTSINAQSNLESPSEFLGYELGSQWTPHHKVMDYFWHVTEQSPLVEGHQYGTTNEGRELMLTVISSAENMQRLDEIRTNNLKRTGLEDGTPTEDSTAIVWLSYNVHGNETSSSEAAMKTIYELVRADNAQAKTWLQNTVVLMDPMLNPDGRDRYVDWYKGVVGEQMNVHPDAREHHEPWPGGRTNHYYFDLNRDWAWLTQKESRHRVAEYQKWMPHIHVDFHEQGVNSPYYFAPAAKPFHPAITDWQSDFQHTIGENNAKYFDEEGWLYFTREVFDLFYPSYGDTYPIFNGAIGMTYEQAGNSRAGLGITTEEGDTLTLSDRLLHHYTTGLSTVEISSRNAEQLVSEFADYYQTAQNNPEGEYKTFVIKQDNNPDKLEALFELLDEHQIEYGQAQSGATLSGYNYQTGNTESVRVSEGDYLISVHQPKGVLARTLFEPRPELEDSVTYDITAWEQHYAYGLDGYALTHQLNVEPKQYQKPEVQQNFPEKPYAYIARWEDLDDLRLLSDFLKHDIKVRFTSGEFKIDDRMYDPGTLVLTRSDNKNMPEFDEKVQELAQNHNQEIHAVETGFAQSGFDLGSSSVQYMNKPSVAMLSGEGTSSNQVGEIWHYFDQQIEYPLTMLDTEYFDGVDLSAYDVLILPSGYYSSRIDSSRLADVKEWISDGGKLIAVQDANSFLAGKDGFSLTNKNGDSSEPEQDDLLETYGNQQREYISSFNSGSVYKITMDNTHPLAYGYEEEYFSLKLDADSYAYLEDGWNVGVAKEDAHMSGFIGHKAKDKVKNTLTFGVQHMGSGSVVYMVDNPLFRAFWYNGKLLFGNAVFMVD